MTKKARFIKQLPNICEDDKKAIIAFFSLNPVYENCIDWNNKALTSSDFHNVIKKAWNSKKNIRKRNKQNPEEIFKDINCRIAAKTEEFLIIMPLDWDCAVFFNSFECGGEGAKWCIGRKKTYKYWNNYLKTGNVFYFVYFLKKSYMWGKKLVIQYNRKNDSFSTYLQNNKCIGGIAPVFEDICRNDLSSYAESMPQQKRYIKKFSIKFLLFGFRPKKIIYVFFCLLSSFLKKEELRKHKKETIKRTKETINRIKSSNMLNDFEFELDETDNRESITIKNFKGRSENLIIPEAVDNIPITTIGGFAFSSNRQIENISLPENLVSIENYAFFYCEKLKSIMLPKKIKYIDSSAFCGCDNLEKIVVDDENPNYISHEGVLFDKKMTTIIKCPPLNLQGKYAVPQTVNMLGDDSFDRCRKLTGIILHKNILMPDNIYFCSCSGLVEFSVDENNMMYKSIDGVLFYKNGKELLRYPQGKEDTDYIIPEKTIRIKSFAFYGCIYLKNIIFPESIEAIGNYAFNNCENLVSLAFPQNLKYIGEEIFDDCPNLESIRLSRKTKRSKKAFSGFKGKIIYTD